MRRSSTTRAFRSHPLSAARAALALLLLAVALPASAVDPCPNVQAPSGNTVAAHVYAKGVQIYRWNGTSWAFVAPEAVLYADAGQQGAVGIHYAGPTWVSVSGSKVVGAAVERCTPDPGAIPWLLLQATSSEGPGLFQGVTFIQRVNTVGGLAPTVPGTVTDEEARVPYTTEYLFYQAHD